MSDRIAKAAGIILLLASILLIVLSLPGKSSSVKIYPTAGNRPWVLEPIRTEQNGDVRINRAEAETLQTLPGIGPAYAGRIIEEKQANGPYHYPEDLEAVRGIGPQTLAGFRDRIDMTLEEGGN